MCRTTIRFLYLQVFYSSVTNFVFTFCYWYVAGKPDRFVFYVNFRNFIEMLIPLWNGNFKIWSLVFHVMHYLSFTLFLCDLILAMQDLSLRINICCFLAHSNCPIANLLTNFSILKMQFEYFLMHQLDPRKFFILSLCCSIILYHSALSEGDQSALCIIEI